jgi:predicted membrane channel-forming protein YqfA (hemolysin III family)
MKPTWRKPAGILAILLLILFWAVIVTTFAEAIGHWPALVQALFYLVTGLVWIAPLKPLLRWAETGRWRAPFTPKD